MPEVCLHQLKSGVFELPGNCYFYAAYIPKNNRESAFFNVY